MKCYFLLLDIRQGGGKKATEAASYALYFTRRNTKRQQHGQHQLVSVAHTPTATGFLAHYEEVEFESLEHAFEFGLYELKLRHFRVFAR